MTQKRQLSEQTSFSVKRARLFTNDQEETCSITDWISSPICWTCDIINHEEECIKKYIEPFEYYNLASVILNPTQVELFKHNDNEKLLRSASLLLNGGDKLEKVFNKLNTYIYQLSIKEIVQDLDKLIGEKLPHKNREIAFVVQLVSHFKNNLDSTIVDLIKENNADNLLDILTLNIKCARLLPLVSFAIGNTVPNFSITISDGGLEEEEEEEEDIEDLTFSSSFSVQVIDMANTSHISSDNDSHLILPVPSSLPVPDSQSVPNSPNTILPESLLRQTSFSVFDIPGTPTTTTTPEEETDAPNYDELSTEEIRAKVKSYGFKPASRNQMITYLEQLRTCLKANTSSQQSKTVSTSDQKGTRTKIQEYLRSRQDIWMKILMYEPLDLDELYKSINIPCKKPELKSILDEFCANVKKPVRVKRKK